MRDIWRVVLILIELIDFSIVVLFVPLLLLAMLWM